ncbi:MAG: Thiol-disulfide oxidoreductase ResA [Bacteroidota bacterium]|jgi:thiol-disulfide isomerase/thioredoxin
MIKYRIVIFYLSITFGASVKTQTIKGNLTLLSNQEITLEGFNGLKSYPISSSTIDEKGNFKLNFSIADYGVGYLISADNKPLFVILSGEDIELVGESLNHGETLKIQKGKENLWFEQYAKEHPRREQALSAWIYLEKLYAMDSLFSVQELSIKNIVEEKQRIINEDADFLNSLPKDSYVSWFLPTRKLVSSVSTIAQYRPEEIPKTIAAFRNLDYTDQRLFKSGLFKDAIESHFWLLENSGKSLDSVFKEMQYSIDAMLDLLIKDEKKFNEVVDYLFDLLERHSLFQASEYLALKVLNETSCTIDSDLAKQLESYRAMKIGNIAPEIELENFSYLIGKKQTEFKNLADLKTPYTLVVFGASWCPKCSEEVPKIVQNYVKWRNTGVEVVYISLDTETTALENSLSQYPFISYCDLKKWGSKVVQDYYVFGTPTMYLLDRNRKILLRPNSVKQMDAWVDWFFIQRNK